jgi:hypothetical protein
MMVELWAKNQYGENKNDAKDVGGNPTISVIWTVGSKILSQGEMLILIRMVMIGIKSINPVLHDKRLPRWY